jgi:hypothetical protein
MSLGGDLLIRQRTSSFKTATALEPLKETRVQTGRHTYNNRPVRTGPARQVVSCNVVSLYGPGTKTP